MEPLQGVCPVVPTPFTRDGEIAPDQYRRIIQFLIDGGCAGATLFGTHSEFQKLTWSERLELLDVAASVSEGTMPLVVSVPDRSTEVAVDRATEMERRGAEYLMVSPPSFLDPSTEDQFHHLASIADAVDIPIMIQYAPETVGGTLDVDFLTRLFTDVDNIDYFKIESLPPGPVVTALDRETKGAIVFDGLAGFHLIESLDRGAVGVMPGSGLHDVYLQIVEQYRDGNRDRAREIHNDLVPFLNHARQTAEMLIYYEKCVLQRRGVLDTTERRRPKYTPDDPNDTLFEEYLGDLDPHLVK
jgi:4-hydroxy-tetrahydrodipicolinate synthase